MVSGLGLGIEITADDLASASLGKVGKSVGKLEGKIGNLGAAAAKVFGGMAAAFGSVKGALAIAKPFAGFELSLAGVGGTLNATTEEMKLLKDAAIQAGMATQFSPKEAADGLGNLASAGFNAAESVKLLNPALDLAAAGQLSVAQSASTMSAAIKVFGLEIDDAAAATDKLLKISNLTSLKASDLEGALGNVSRGAGLTKQSIDEMLPAIGLVKNSGVDASVAANAVSSALSSMADKSKMFKSLGVEVTNADGTFRDFMDVVLDTDQALAKKFPNAAERTSKAIDLFSKFGVGAFQNISSQLNKGIKDANGNLLTGRDALEYLRKSMKDAGGAAAGFKDRLLDTFQGQMTLLQGSAETFQIVFGEAFAKAVRPFVEKGIELLNALIEKWQALPQSTKDAIGKFALAGTAMIALGGIVVAVGGAFALLGIAVGPIIAVFAAIALMAGALAVEMDSAEEGATSLADGFTALWDGLLHAFDVVSAKVSAFFDGFLDGFREAIDPDTMEDLSNALSELGAAFGSMSGDTDGATSAGKQFGSVFGTIASALIKVFTAGVRIVTGFVTVWEEMGGALTPVTDALSDVGTEIKKVFADMGLLGGSTESTKTAFQTLGGIIAVVIRAAAVIVGTGIRTIGGLLRSVVTLVSGVVDIVAGIFSGNWSRVWTGVKKVVFAAVSAVISIVSAMVEAIAGAIDAAISMTGKKSELAKSVKGFKDNLLQGLQDKFGIVEEKAEIVAPVGTPASDAPVTAEQMGKAGLKALDEVLANQPSKVPPVPSPAGQIDVASQTSAMKDAAVAAAVAAAKAQPAPIAKATLTVDGKQLAEIVAQHSRDAANAGSLPVDVSQ